jgi:hypothetical protein
VARYLVVANQTLAGEHLLEQVRDCLSKGSCSFYIVVPATSPSEHAVWTEGEATALAQVRLDAALGAFRQLGADADGEVGDANPMDAIRDVLREGEFDAIILSTLPPGISRWLGQDLPHRVEKEFDLPVTHVIGDVKEEQPEG